MIIPITKSEEERLADAVFFMWDIMDRIEGMEDNHKVWGTWEALDEAIAHLKAIEDHVDW